MTAGSGRYSATITSTALSRNGVAPLPVAVERGADEEHALASAMPSGLPDWGIAAIHAAAVPRGVFVGHGDRPTPFGAEGKALDHADEHEQDRREDADSRVGRQHADQKVAPPMTSMARDEDGLASEPVSRCSRRLLRRAAA